MLTTAYLSHENSMEDFSKLNKNLNSHNLLQQSIDYETPISYQTGSSQQLSKSKIDDSLQAANYFNNPFPQYFQSHIKSETNLSCESNLSDASSAMNNTQQENTNYVASSMNAPQPLIFGTKYSGAMNMDRATKKPKPQKKRISKAKCTCKQDTNRIPRPRNAFILFRQKHHQLILEESGKAKTNPEVSRELAFRWKQLSEVDKEYWNNLAQEEKKNHAAKYPDYRYKPRRNGYSGNCEFCKNKTKMKLEEIQTKHQKLSDPNIQLNAVGNQSKSPLSQQNVQQQAENSFLLQKYLFLGSPYSAGQLGFCDYASAPSLSPRSQSSTPPGQSYMNENQNQFQHQQRNNQLRNYVSPNNSQATFQLFPGNTSQELQQSIMQQTQPYENNLSWQQQEQPSQGLRQNPNTFSFANNSYNLHDIFSMTPQAPNYMAGFETQVEGSTPSKQTRT